LYASFAFLNGILGMYIEMYEWLLIAHNCFSIIMVTLSSQLSFI